MVAIRACGLNGRSVGYSAFDVVAPTTCPMPAVPIAQPRLLPVEIERVSHLPACQHLKRLASKLVGPVERSRQVEIAAISVKLRDQRMTIIKASPVHPRLN